MHVCRVVEIESHITFESHTYVFSEQSHHVALLGMIATLRIFFFSVPVCAITASGVPGGTVLSMNRFSTLCG
jgi:hypothetical protein